MSNLVQNNTRISTKKITQNINRPSAFQHLKKIEYTLKLDMWMTHLVTEVDKLNRVSAAVFLFSRLNKKSVLTDW